VLSGTGPSAAVAHYGAVVLGRIGRPTATITATGVSMADQALTLRRGDVLLLLASYTCLHTHAAVLLNLARRQRIPVVLVTDVLANIEHADLVLTCPRGLPEQSTHAVTVLLLEAIAVALAATDRLRATTALRELNRLRGELLATPADVDLPKKPR